MEKLRNYLLIIFTIGYFSCQEESVTQYEPSFPAVDNHGIATLNPSVGLPLTWCDLVRDTYIGPAIVPPADQITTYNTTVDGNVRTFDVYVPPGYPNNGPYPVVFMFHGTGQTSTKISQSTEWHEHSRSGEDFIVVYPQAESYDMVKSNGSIQHQTKWMTEHAKTQMLDSTLALDDVEFFRSMLNGVVARMEVDCRKIYACGFSNGGSFVKSDLRYHFGNQLAATVSTGGIGSPVRYYPDKGHDSPHLETCGTLDAPKLAAFGYATSLPLDPVDILNSSIEPNLNNFARDCGFIWPLISPITTVSGASVLPTITGPIPRGVRINYSAQTDSSGDPYWTEIEYYDTQTRYRFRMVDELTHALPSSTATPPYLREEYIPIYWEFMNAYSLD